MFENDYTINGKHATYLKFLAAKNSGAKDADEAAPTAARIFERYIDVYMNAAIWGSYMSGQPQRTPVLMTEQEFTLMLMLLSVRIVFLYTEW